MAQVDRAMRRAAYDVGYKDELVAVLEAEVEALRAGRAVEADALRRARIAAQGGPATSVEARSDRHTQPDDDAAASPASLIEPDHDRALGAGGAPETGTQPDLDTGPDAGTMPPVPAGRRMSGRTDLAGPSDHGSWADGSWAERPDTWTDGTGGWAGR
jgi:hypothetical protein